MENSDNKKSIKDASFWELLADKKGNKFADLSVSNNKTETKSQDNVKKPVLNKPKEVKPKSTNSSANKTSDNKKVTSSSSSLKDVSFWALLADKKGEKYSSKPIESNTSNNKENNSVSDSKVNDVTEKTPIKQPLSDSSNKETPQATKEVVPEKEKTYSNNAIIPTAASTPKSDKDKVAKSKTASKSPIKTKKKKKGLLWIILGVIILGIAIAAFFFWAHLKAYYYQFTSSTSSADHLKELIQDQKDKLSAHDTEKTDNSLINSENTGLTEEDQTDTENSESDEDIDENSESVNENNAEENNIEPDEDEDTSNEQGTHDNLASQEEYDDLENETKTEEDELVHHGSDNEASEDNEEKDYSGSLKEQIVQLKNDLKASKELNKENEKTISKLENKIESLTDKLNNSSSSKTSNSSSSNSGDYNVVVGSYGKKSSANKKVEKLKQKGYNNTYVAGKNKGLYVVSIGAFNSRSDAKEAMEKYRADGGSAFVRKL